MLFPPSAVERAMQIKEVLVRAMNKEYSWLRAAEILGITPRGLRRVRQRMEQFGYQGLVDRRRGRPSPRRTPVAELERILELYRERYSGFNARHFFQTVRREHGVKLSYTCVKQILQAAGLIKKRRARGRHRRRRERKPRFGQMLHLDGSRHGWLALVPEERQTLIQVVDDATSRLLYAQLWPGETTRAVMTAMREVVREHGIPESFYTDRAGWAFDTPKAGGKVSKTNLTQVGEALARLGVEHIPSYSPQARGRSERMNRTLQDRLVNELRAAESPRPRRPMTTCASAICPPTTRSSPSSPRIRRVPSWRSTTSIWTRSSSSKRSARSARTTRSASTACCSRSTSSRDAARAPGWRCRCAATSTAATPFAVGPSSSVPTTARGGLARPRPTTPTHQDAAGTTQAARVDSRVVPAISSYGSSAGPGRARVPASGRLRLPPAGTPLSRVASKA